jgi:hypothetical protein
LAHIPGVGFRLIVIALVIVERDCRVEAAVRHGPELKAA